jgi:alkylation response protein AidB-like acyl-CoA dehydrogenase
MDFSLSDIQQQLQDSVLRFVREQYPFETWRKVVATEKGFKDENWKQMAELGWLGVAIPEDFGGLGGGPVDTSVIMEGFGRGLVAEPYLTTAVIGGTFLVKGGTDAQKQELLPKLIEGNLKLAFAQAEPTSRYNLGDVQTTAKKSGNDYTLDGHKAVVLDAPSADKLIVTARTAGSRFDKNGITLFLVDRTAPGVSLREYRTVDNRRGAEVTLSGVKVGADRVIGQVDGGLPLVEEVVDYAISALAAEAVGCMQVLCDTTNEYLKTRKQFGRPIGEFQVLQHRMVDMWINLEQARSMSLMASMKLDDPAERPKALAATKTQIGQAGRFVGYQSIQLHGGMGMTDELNVGHYVKRLLAIDTMFGTADHHLQRFAQMG